VGRSGRTRAACRAAQMQAKEESIGGRPAGSGGDAVPCRGYQHNYLFSSQVSRPHIAWDAFCLVTEKSSQTVATACATPHTGLRRSVTGDRGPIKRRVAQPHCGFACTRIVILFQATSTLHPPQANLWTRCWRIQRGVGTLTPRVVVAVVKSAAVVALPRGRIVLRLRIV
jgi:hypothetical protein